VNLAAFVWYPASRKAANTDATTDSVYTGAVTTFRSSALTHNTAIK